MPDTAATLTIEGAGNTPPSAERVPGPRARANAAQLEAAKTAAAGVTASVKALWAGFNGAMSRYIAADTGRPALMADVVEWATRLLKAKPKPSGEEFASAMLATGAAHNRGAETEVKPYKQLSSRMLTLARWSDPELTSEKDTARLRKAGGVEVNGAVYESPTDALRKSGASVAAVLDSWRKVARPVKVRSYRRSVEDALRDLFPKLAVQRRTGGKVESTKIAGHRGLLVLLIDLATSALVRIDTASAEAPQPTTESPEA